MRHQETYATLSEYVGSIPKEIEWVILELEYISLPDTLSPILNAISILFIDEEQLMGHLLFELWNSFQSRGNDNDITTDVIYAVNEVINDSLTGIYDTESEEDARSIEDEFWSRIDSCKHDVSVHDFGNFIAREYLRQFTSFEATCAGGDLTWTSFDSNGKIIVVIELGDRLCAI